VDTAADGRGRTEPSRKSTGNNYPMISDT
jgi:hypothetical protein